MHAYSLQNYCIVELMDCILLGCFMVCCDPCLPLEKKIQWVFINKSAVHNILIKFHVRNYCPNARSNNDRLRQILFTPGFYILSKIFVTCSCSLLWKLSRIHTLSIFRLKVVRRKRERPTPLSLYLSIFISFSSSITSRHETLSVQMVTMYYLLYII